MSTPTRFDEGNATFRQRPFPPSPDQNSNRYVNDELLGLKYSNRVQSEKIESLQNAFVQQQTQISQLANRVYHLERTQQDFIPDGKDPTFRALRTYAYVTDKALQLLGINPTRMNWGLSKKEERWVENNLLPPTYNPMCIDSQSDEK